METRGNDVAGVGWVVFAVIRFVQLEDLSFQFVLVRPKCLYSKEFPFTPVMV